MLAFSLVSVLKMTWSLRKTTAGFFGPKLVRPREVQTFSKTESFAPNDSQKITILSLLNRNYDLSNKFDEQAGGNSGRVNYDSNPSNDLDLANERKQSQHRDAKHAHLPDNSDQSLFEGGSKIQGGQDEHAKIWARINVNSEEG